MSNSGLVGEDKSLLLPTESAMPEEIIIGESSVDDSDSSSSTIPAKALHVGLQMATDNLRPLLTKAGSLANAAKVELEREALPIAKQAFDEWKEGVAEEWRVYEERGNNKLSFVLTVLVVFVIAFHMELIELWYQVFEKGGLYDQVKLRITLAWERHQHLRRRARRLKQKQQQQQQQPTESGVDITKALGSPTSTASTVEVQSALSGQQNSMERRKFLLLNNNPPLQSNPANGKRNDKPGTTSDIDRDSYRNPTALPHWQVSGATATKGKAFRSPSLGAESFDSNQSGRSKGTGSVRFDDSANNVISSNSNSQSFFNASFQTDDNINLLDLPSSHNNSLHQSGSLHLTQALDGFERHPNSRPGILAGGSHQFSASTLATRETTNTTATGVSKSDKSEKSGNSGGDATLTSEGGYQTPQSDNSSQPNSTSEVKNTMDNKSRVRNISRNISGKLRRTNTQDSSLETSPTPPLRRYNTSDNNVTPTRRKGRKNATSASGNQLSQTRRRLSAVGGGIDASNVSAHAGGGGDNHHHQRSASPRRMQARSKSGTGATTYTKGQRAMHPRSRSGNNAIAGGSSASQMYMARQIRASPQPAHYNHHNHGASVGVEQAPPNRTPSRGKLSPTSLQRNQSGGGRLQSSSSRSSSPVRPPALSQYTGRPLRQQKLTRELSRQELGYE